MLNKTGQWLIIGGCAVVVGIVAFVGIEVFGIYRKGWDGTVARGVAWALHLPAITVGDKGVSLATYLEDLKAEQAFLQGAGARAQGLSQEMTAEVRAGVAERTIRRVAVEMLADREKIVVTPIDVDRSYQQIVAGMGTTTTPEVFEGFLKNEMGWNVDLFKKYVVRPAFIEDSLATVASTTKKDLNTDLQNLLKGAKVLIK